jgi:hypothetical protein
MMLRMEQEYVVPFGDVKLSLGCSTCKTEITVNLSGTTWATEHCPNCRAFFGREVMALVREITQSVESLQSVLARAQIEGRLRFLVKS